MRSVVISIFFAVGIVFFSSLVTEAAGIVPCSGPECQSCHFIQLGDNILKFFITIMATIAAVIVAVAGFKMVVSGGDPGAISSAREMITNVVVGFMILLTAWLIVDTVMKIFVKDSGFGPWNEIQCVTQPVVPTPTTPTTPPTTPGDPGVTPGGCTGECASLPSGIAVKQGACSGAQACTVSSEILPQLTALDSSLDSSGIDWRVTEAYPPTRVHQNSCHSNGTCVDANCIGTCTNEQVKTFIDSANNAGLRAVYEVSTQSQKDSLVKSGVNANNVQVLGSWISAAHFSVYKQ